MDDAFARDLGLQPLARLVAYAVTGCLPEEMGLGPITAIPKALAHAGLSLNDIGLIELNEAFAAQVLAVIRALGSIPSALMSMAEPSLSVTRSAALALNSPQRFSGNESERHQIRYGHHVRRRRHGCRRYL